MKFIGFILLLSFLGLNVITRADDKIAKSEHKLEIVRASDLIKQRSIIEKVLVADKDTRETETKKKISKRFGFIPGAGVGVVERVVPVPVATRLVAVPVNRFAGAGLGLGARIDSGMFNTGGFETGLGNGFGSGLTGGLNGLGGNVGGLSLGGGGIQGLGGNLGAGLDNSGFGLGLRRNFGPRGFMSEDRFHRFGGDKTVIVVAPNNNRITNNNAVGGSSNINREVDDDDEEEFDRDDRRRRRIFNKHFN